MLKVFQKWGMPRCIKFDNGLPFGVPSRKLIPFLSLWLIGLGIRVIFNRPGRPTDNSKVERMQAVTNNWAVPIQCMNVCQMQKSLNHNINLQRNDFKLRRHQNKTRSQLYPKLYEPYKAYEKDSFDMRFIHQLLTKGYWERLVSKNGQIYFYDQQFYLGRTHQRQNVQIQFDLDKLVWCVSDTNGQLIKQITVVNICKDILCDLTKLSKN